MKGTALVNAFLAEHKTDMRRLFNRSLVRGRVALRVKLIRHLHAEGLNYSEIARVLDVGVGTARYWLIEHERLAKMRERNARHKMKQRRKIYYQWEECAQAMEHRA